jgi:hypothetical protein
MTRPIILCLLAATLACLAPAAAGASPTQESMFQDDHLLASSNATVQERTLKELESLGVDSIRSNFLWSAIAPEPNSKRRPRFDATDPAAYPEAQIARFDRLVRGAAEHGIELQVTITGPIPAWASDCGGSLLRRRTCRPDPREFGRFATALAKRYDGTFGDLPRVSRWSIWNEPNQAGWLYPQYSRIAGAYRPEAARRYRDLAYAAIAALRENGHKGDTIMLGETAPLGRYRGPWAKRNVAPVPFLRAVLCMTARGGRLGGREGKALGCGTFKQLMVTAAAHHPYNRAASGSPRQPVAAGDITMPTLGRLTRLLARARHLRRVPRRLPVYLTEFGIQTNPPDRPSGVPLAQQARWINEVDWIAYQNPRIESVAQYVLSDERSIAGSQTGLRFRNGRAKPSYAAYRLPLWVVRRGGRTSLWGQVRDGGIGTRATVSYQARRGGGWRTFRTVSIGNARGYFRLRTTRAAYRWRIASKPAHGSRKLSRAAKPEPR